MQKNILDNFIEYFNPAAAVQRFQQRVNLSVLEKKQQRGYEGASPSRYNQDWYAAALSSNVEIQRDLKWLRQRSRDLCRNNPYAKQALRVIPNNIVGTGIIPEPTVIGRSGKANVVKEVWKKWAENTKCDYDNRKNFYGIQSLIIKTIIQSGECLIVKRKANSKYYLPLRLQVLEGDYINDGRFSLLNEYGGITWYGVAFNAQGERVGYWLWDRHPGELAKQDFFVKAEDVIHIYNEERPGQVRGVPEFHAIMLRTKNLDDYEFTETIRAKSAASLVAFVTQDDEATANTASPYSTMEPGSIYRLNKGEEVTVNTPPSSTQFDPFVKNSLHAIAAGISVTYESLTGDLKGTSFSSARMGWLEFNRNIEHWQWNILIPVFNAVAFEWFVDAAKVAGKIPFGADVSATWTAPRRQMIDPYKETKAIIEMVRGKLISLGEAQRELGYNPEEILEEVKKEFEDYKKAGLKPESMPEFDADRKDMQPNRTDAAAMKE